MSIEYVTTRLKAIRCRFPSEEVLESIITADDYSTVSALLRDSVFEKSIEGQKNRSSRIGGRQAVIRSVDETRLNILYKAVEIVRSSMPEVLEPLFSRVELEQVKDVLRLLHYGEPVYERRFRLLPILRKDDWSLHWRAFGTLKEYKAALEKYDNPFAEAIKPEEGKIKWEEMETLLDIYYFGKYLPSKRSLLGSAYDYFESQCDQVNVNRVFLLRVKNEPEELLKKHYIPGPGKIKFSDFAAMITSPTDDFLRQVEKVFNTELHVGVTTDAARFSQSLRRSLLYRHRIKTIIDPHTLLDILVFLDELEVMVSIIKLALNFRGASIPYIKTADYFISRKVA